MNAKLDTWWGSSGFAFHEALRSQQRYSSEELKHFAKLAAAQVRRFGISASDAEDISQLVLIDLTFCPEPVHTPRAWVRKVALRKAWKLRQRNSYAAHVSLGDHERVCEPDLDARLDLANLFARLPEEDADLWILRRVEQLSIAELTRQDPASASTLKRRLSRTTEKLQRSISR